MSDYAFRLLNVFTLGDDRFSGNPLCVFEDGRGLTGAVMQALARQLNLSETTFIFPPTVPEACADVRIFTPTFEMPFAGHPTLGTACVVSDLQGGGDSVALAMKAGVIAVMQGDGVWTLQTAGGLATRVPASRADLAAMLGLSLQDVGECPLWVDTGAEQLIVPLTSVDAVRRAQPSADLLARHGFSKKRGASMAYVWAREDDGSIAARFFFVANGSVVEDPATGSACANLGGWMLATGASTPVSVQVRQGDAVKRPSLLRLRVDEQRRIFVGGSVLEIGRGTIAAD